MASTRLSSPCAAPVQLLAPLLLTVLLLLAARPTAAACGNPPEHCKGVGETCVSRPISECTPPAKCRDGRCCDGTNCGSSSSSSSSSACGNPPVHCKPQGAPCVSRPVSECIAPYRCREGICSSGVPPPITTAVCTLPVSPFTVNPTSGTPAAHKAKHLGDTNYKNVNAVDLKAPAGTPIYAVADGVLCTGGCFAISSGSSNKWGYSFEIQADSGNHFFYTHVDTTLPAGTAPGRRVTKGQPLGVVSAAPAGSPSHLHFAMKEDNPCSFLRGCKSIELGLPDPLPC